MSESKTSKRDLLFKSGLGLAALTGGLGVYYWQSNNDSKPKSAAKHSLQNLKLPDVTGNTVDLARFTQKPVLINFWATWCPPCIEELPLLNAFYKEHAANGIQVLGIAIDKPASVVKFIEKQQIDYPHVIAGFEGLQLTQALGNDTGGLPYTIVIDPNANILYAKKGQLSANELSSTLKWLI